MKIALVSQSYYPHHGGVTENVHHSATELRRLGHDVTVVTAGFGSDQPDSPGVVRIGRNVLVPFNGAWVNVTVGARLARDLGRVFDSLEPEIIHTHCPVAPTLPLLTLMRAPKRCRLIGTFHEAAAGNFAYWACKGALRRAAMRLDARIAVSQAALDLARKYIQGDYVVIPNGVDPERFSPKREPIDDLRDGAFNVLYVGRLDRRKGVKHLFHAVSLAARRTDRRIRIVVVGNDDLRRRFLPRLSRRIEVYFAGIVGRDDLPRYFASGDVFCSPAVDRESFGIVLLEAMASGIPVIGTSIPGYLTLLTDRWNALVVPPRDPVALARAIIEIANDDELRLRLRETGLRFVERYKWPSIVQRLERLYTDGRVGDCVSTTAAERVESPPYQIQKA
jgi:phosphatidylinositol alpha-mannosyltransferase